MAYLIETTTFDPGIYRIETSDPVIGGETGIANKSSKGLANRTNWLKSAYDAMSIVLTGIQTTLSSLGSAATKNVNAIKTTDNLPLWQSIYSKDEIDAIISSAGIKLAGGTKTIGDIASSGVSVTVSLGLTLLNSNYAVFGSMVSKSTNPQDDTNVIWTVTSRGNTSFVIFCRETGATTQNIDFDWEIRPK